MPDRIARALASDRAFRVAGWLTLALVLLMLTIARLVIPDIAKNTEANVRTDDLASCRGSYRSDIDEASFAVSEASFGVTTALGDAQSALSDGVVASIRQDPTTLALVAAELEAAEERKQEAFREAVAAYGALADAIAAYDAANALSSEDPDRFLAECKESP